MYFVVLLAIVVSVTAFSPMSLSGIRLNPRLSMSADNADQEAREAERLRAEAKSDGKTMFGIKDFKDVPPTTIDDVLPGNKLEPGNIINILLFGYIGYLFVDSIRLLIIGATTTPPPGM
jgi:hypothetical protein